MDLAGHSHSVTGVPAGAELIMLSITSTSRSSTCAGGPSRACSHPCRDALLALRRRVVKRLSGQSWVPVLVTDEGRAFHESAAIIDWAETHPAERRRGASAGRSRLLR